MLPARKTYRLSNTEIAKLDRVIVHTKNSLGFRGPDLPVEGLDSYLGIIAVGGSTTEGAYLSDGDDWPAVLRDRLERDFDRLWLNNAGLDGHSTYGHAILLADHVLKLKPKVILLLVGANEVKHGDTTAHIKGGITLESAEDFLTSLVAYSEAAALGLNAFRYVRARSQGLPHAHVDLASRESSRHRSGRFDAQELTVLLRLDPLHQGGRTRGGQHHP